MADKEKRVRGYRRVWLCAALAALPTLAVIPASAQAQDVGYAKQGTVVCVHPMATVSMKAAIDQKADQSQIDKIANEGFCTPLAADVPFREVKPVQVTLPSGTVDEIVGEVTLSDGSRSRFYILKNDIAPPKQ
jgi:hypothetical protein